MSRLYPCVYCTEDGYCEKYSDDEVTSWCVQSPCKDEKPSNADRIRSMSDEELAEFLTPVKCVDCHLLDCGVGEIGNQKTCSERVLDWLREECE